MDAKIDKLKKIIHNTNKRVIELGEENVTLDKDFNNLKKSHCTLLEEFLVLKKRVDTLENIFHENLG